MSQLVFVSHATQDLPYARELVDALEVGGIDCWFGAREVPPGADYAAAIHDGVTRATAFVILCSASSAASEDCLTEFELATKRRITRFPVRLDDTEFDGGFGYRLALLQWINGSAADVARSILDELGSQRRPSAADLLLKVLSGVVRGGYETDEQILDAAESAWIESDLATRREVVRDRGLACIELVRAEFERRREGGRGADLRYFFELVGPGMGDEPEHVANLLAPLAGGGLAPRPRDHDPDPDLAFGLAAPSHVACGVIARWIGSDLDSRPSDRPAPHDREFRGGFHHPGQGGEPLRRVVVAGRRRAWRSFPRRCGPRGARARSHRVSRAGPAVRPGPRGGRPSRSRPAPRAN